MHGINTGDGECESAAGNYGCSSSCNLRWTADGNAYCFGGINLFLDTINSAERVNGFSGYSESGFNNNLHSYRHGW